MPAIHHHPRSYLIVLSVLLAVVVSSCGTPPSVFPPSAMPALHEKDYESFDEHELPYQRWLPKKKVTLIVIGFHGIAGASDDMANLGAHLTTHLPGTAVYAPELRGQGRDPIPAQRGDIRTSNDWIADAHTFTALVRSKHPGVPLIWCGESMGALIALHACANSPLPPCDGLILSSPVSTTGDQISTFRRLLLRIAATLHPRYRVSLEALAGVDQVQITRDVIHDDQVNNNPWHIPEFTLRLLRYLESMINQLSAQATKITVPTLILHGGKDIFSDPADIERFAAQFPPEARVQRKFYSESYHLLFYDHQSDQVLADLTTWLQQLPSTK